ncbi:MAG: HEAT repeat domain-containing protein [Desulfobacteraceae bacterium]|nr:MAG: HEAT repeat domain-containing protein [Desulfobacteraceae bacterium]
MKVQRIPKGTIRLLILLLSGFCVAQILSTVHLYFSNTAFHDKLMAVHHAGYLAVPNMQVAPHLNDWTSAFNGGLFFSLTSGLALTIFSIFAAWVRFNLSWEKTVPIILNLIWVAGLIMVNRNGFSSLITAYLIFIPCTILPFFRKLFSCLSSCNDQLPAKFSLFFHVLLFVLFSIGCASQMKVEKFLDIRDFLFLGNPTGEAINAFYYDNSLYSANYFKSFSQKLIKTCDLESLRDKQLKQQIRRILNYHDYLSLESFAQADLKTTVQDDMICLSHQKKIILTVSVQDFLRSTKQYIHLFESKTDRHAIFRIITMASLLFVGAILLYSITFLLPFLLTKNVLNPAWSVVTAALICILILVVLLGVKGSNKINDLKHVAAALKSEDSITRIKALRYIVDQTMDITLFPESETLAINGTIPERYWIAKALSRSRNPDSRNTLLRLLEDNHFNVVCMALHSMGKQGRKTDIPIILEKIQSSNNWYVQWYAYKALRNLGWYQKIMN